MKDEINFNNLTEHELDLKAVAIIFAISTLAQSIIESFQTQIEEFKDFKQDELNKVSFIVSYVLLFNIQRNIWEANFFIDEQKSSDFEKKLFKIFENLMELTLFLLLKIWLNTQKEEIEHGKCNMLVVGYVENLIKKMLS